MPDTTSDADTALLRASFERAADALGLGRARREAVLDDLLVSLSEPHRRYHDARHVAACVRLAEVHRDHALHFPEVIAALLFHDAIYEPTSTHNEAQSAALALEGLTRLGARAEVLERVERLVLPTRGHEAAGDPDAELVLACDLAVLGADDTERAAFERGVRAEHAFVDEAAYRFGRAHVLEALLAKDRIYAVPAIFGEREARARAHLAATLAALRA
jgi:predicted metal-dependent HD superfamily phosphohydrolase